MSEKRSLSDATSKYTEDDTFDRLRRTPIHLMDLMYKEHWYDFYFDANLYKSWLDDNGWKDKEFMTAGKAYGTDRRRRNY